MSAIAAVLDRGGRDGAARERLASVLAGARGRGAELSGTWVGDGVALGVSRHAWQADAHLAGPAAPVADARAVVVSDAAVHYRDDLRRALRAAGVEPLADTPAALIHAAWCAWGPACVERLEGDHAFVVWDRQRRQLFASRDFGGKRPLFTADAGEAVLVGSSAVGLSLERGVDARLDRAAIAEAIGGLWPMPGETAFVGVRAVEAGGTITVAPDGRLVAARPWAPEPRSAGRLSFDDGADALRSLLITACTERLPADGPVAVTLSGGWDSPAVFACAHEAAGARVRAVSAGYPEGSEAREDELIAAIHAHRGTSSRWMAGAEVDFLGDAAARAAVRDDVIGHAYDAWNRTLLAHARATGARVVFDGSGGDQLFGSSTLYLADLLRGGRWLALRRACRELGITDIRHFVGLVALPAAPAPVWRLAEWRAGAGLLRPLEHRIPGWLDKGFLAEARLVERQAALVRRPAGRALNEHELAFYLRTPYFPRIFAVVAGLALDAGVESRSPLYDRRIVDFAIRRPMDERGLGRETKRLLRRAMAPLLPAEVLAPRPRRTGTVGSLLERGLREAPPAVAAVLQERLVLEELGIVDGARLRRDWARFRDGSADDLAAGLTFTLLGELWLRARRDGAAAARAA